MVWENAVCTTTFLVKFFCVAGYLKRSNDTPEKHNFHIDLE